MARNWHERFGLVFSLGRWSRNVLFARSYSRSEEREAAASRVTRLNEDEPRAIAERKRPVYTYVLHYVRRRGEKFMRNAGEIDEERYDMRETERERESE